MTGAATHDLASAAPPEIDRLVRRLGLGRFDDDGGTAPAGRNDAWTGTTGDGTRVFVKRVGDGSDAWLPQFRRILTFGALSARPELADVRMPRLFGHDIESRLVVFELLADGSSGAELAGEDAFGAELSRQAGRLVGMVHACHPEVAPGWVDASPPPSPVVSFLDALPQPVFQALTGAELELWRMMQADEALAEALRELRRAEATAPHTFCHCDLRLDQFLRSDGVLYLTDWEEFRLADPARDIGGFAGEWLYRAVLGIPDPGGELTDPLTHEKVVDRGVRKLEQLRPNIRAFWEAYRLACPDADDGLAVRAVRFAGWHLLDRALARAGQAVRLSALDRAGAGIGRNALLEPESFVSVLGLDAP
ncbi:class V lanthionine synthetase subunit LxmK [Nonomuraea sp. NPDC003707]